LRKDDAIEGLRGNVISAGQVGDNGRFGISFFDMKNFALANSISTKFSGIAVVPNLQNTSLDVQFLAG
jgi:hypothetical protein